MQRSRKLLACSLVLIGLGFCFSAEVRAQPAPPPPPPPTPPAQGTAPAPAPPAPPSAPAPAPPEAVPPPETPPSDPGAAPTSSAAPEAVAVPAEPEVSTGGGLFESSQSATGDAAAGAGVGGGADSFDLGGYVRGDVFVGKEPGTKRSEIKAAYGELSLKVNTPKQEYGDAYAEARVRYGLQDVEQRVYLDLREAYVNAYLGPLDLRLGQQIIVWGRADAFNPTNNISAVDWRVRSPVEDDRRLGNVGLRAFLNFAPMRLEGVWMPLYVPTELPAGLVPELVRMEPTGLPDPALENGLGAGRLHLELPAFEASVSYLYGHAPMPGLVLTDFTGGENAYVGVARTPYKHHVIGADFSTAFGEVFALRGEAAYRRPVDWEDEPWSARPDLQYVLGVDRTFGTVNVIAQYMGRYVFDWELAPAPAEPLTPERLIRLQDPPGPPDAVEIARISINEQLARTSQILFGQRAETQHMATLRIEWLLAHDTLSISALGMVNFTTEEWLLFPKLAYKMSDALSTSIGGEFFSGPKDTLIGLVEAELSAGYAELRYSF